MPSIEDLKSLLAPTGCEELDVTALSLPYTVLCRSIEVVDGPSVAPYGTLVVRFAEDPETDVTLTLIEPGWKHPGQFVGIGAGTIVTRVRVWK